MPFPNLDGRPPLFETVEQLEGLINGYFESCFGKDENDNKIQLRPITIEGLAYDIGCDRKTIHNYKGRKDINGKNFFFVIKRAIDRCQVSLVEHAMTARNPAGAIWLGCNNYDYVNKTDIHVSQELEQLNAHDVKKMIEEKSRDNCKLLESRVECIGNSV